MRSCPELIFFARAGCSGLVPMRPSRPAHGLVLTRSCVCVPPRATSPDRGLHLPASMARPPYRLHPQIQSLVRSPTRPKPHRHLTRHPHPRPHIRPTHAPARPSSKAASCQSSSSRSCSTSRTLSASHTRAYPRTHGLPSPFAVTPIPPQASSDPAAQRLRARVYFLICSFVPIVVLALVFNVTNAIGFTYACVPLNPRCLFC